MDPIKEKFIVDKFLSKAKDDDNTRTAAQAINSVTYDTLSGAKFIAELLQNADDAAYKLPADVEGIAKFTLLPGGYLLFQHNGKPFDEGNITAICDVANRTRDKIKDINQTGNKGLGFKSVFSIANYVLIRSDGYSFCFNEEYHQWKDQPEAYPWQIIPIWTADENVPPQVKKYLNDNITNFIFKIRSSEQLNEIQQSLADYCQDSKNLLFLRKISKIGFHDLNNKQSIELNIESSAELPVEEKSEYSINKVSIASAKNKVKSIDTWYKYTVNYLLSNEMKGIASKLPDRLEKYKQASQLPITLAINFQESNFVRAQSPQVYCFFKTDISFDFPFIVNADFLLDTSRANWNTDSMAAKWNAGILREIFFRQFEFIQYISVNFSIWPHVINMLAIPNRMELGVFKTSKSIFEQAFNAAKARYSLVTNLPEESILHINNSVIDKFYFIKFFGNDELQKSSANPKIENKELMKELGAREFDIDDILSEVIKSEFLAKLVNPEYNLKFLRHINKLIELLKEDSSSIKKIIDCLSKVPFVLTSQKKLKQPQDVCLSDETLKYSIKDFTFISVVHAVLMANHASLKVFLEAFKIKTITFKKMIEEANKDPENSVPFLAALEKMQTNLEKQDWTDARQVKLKTKTGKHLEVSEIYLSKKYAPNFIIEDYVDQADHVIADDYLGEEERLDDQKNFLIKLGINHTVSQSNAKRLFEVVSRSNTDKMFAFTKYLFLEFYISLVDEKQRLFPLLRDLFKENKFLLKTNTGKNFVPNECYLSDFYRPDMQLEDIVEEINYVSDEYVDELSDEGIFQRWREFFIELGVSQSIAIKITEESNRPSVIAKYPGEAIQYFNLLDSDEDDQPYYLPIAARRYAHQHSISHFFYIKFIEKILETPLFWRIISNEWDKIKNVTVTYWSQVIAKTPIPSSIEYYVRLYCLKKFKQKPKDLYMPLLKQYFSEDELQGFPIAMIDGELTDEQWKYFKFKTLTLSDCYVLLNRIAKKPADDSTLAKIDFLYQKISRFLIELVQIKQEDISMEEKGVSEREESEEESKKETEKPQMLFSHAQQFAEISSLYGLLSETLALTKLSPRVLMKPKDISLEQLDQLCRHFSVTVIKDSDLQVSAGNKLIDTSLRKRIEEKLSYILLIDAEKQQATLSDEFLKEFISKNFSGIKLKLERFICWQAETLAISYQDVLEEKIDNWMQDEILYVRSDAAGPKANTTMYQHIVRYLELKIPVVDLWEILELSIEEIVIKYPVCTDHNIALVNEGMLIDRDSTLPVISTSVVNVPDTRRKRKLLIEVKKEAEEKDLPPESKKLKGDPDLTGDSAQPAVVEETGEMIDSEEEDQVNQDKMVFPEAQPQTQAFHDEEPEEKTEDSSSESGLEMSAIAPVSNPMSIPFNLNAVVQPTSSIFASFASPQFNSYSSQTSRNRTQSTRMIFSSLTKAERLAIGRQGEEFIYNRFLKDYKDKYANYHFVDMPDGFTMTKDNVKKEVHWQNKIQESYQPYDLTLSTYVDDELTKIKYIEVKTQANNREEIEFSISMNEYNKMLECASDTQAMPQTRYRLFWVQHIDKPGEEKVIELGAEDLTGQNANVQIIDFKRVHVSN